GNTPLSSQRVRPGDSVATTSPLRVTSYICTSPSLPSQSSRMRNAARSATSAVGASRSGTRDPSSCGADGEESESDQGPTITATTPARTTTTSARTTRGRRRFGGGGEGGVDGGSGRSGLGRREASVVRGDTSDPGDGQR